jgi:hypothetical protein
MKQQPPHLNLCKYGTARKPKLQTNRLLTNWWGVVCPTCGEVAASGDLSRDSAIKMWNIINQPQTTPK